MVVVDFQVQPFPVVGSRKRTRSPLWDASCVILPSHLAVTLFWQRNMEDDTQLDVEIEMAEVDLNADSAPAGEPKKKRERREPQPFTREPGRSLFPHSRVQKIIKADRVRSELHERLLNVLISRYRRSLLLQRTRLSSCLWRLKNSLGFSARLDRGWQRKKSG